ncbi:MAG: response regulator [Caldimonas sp.]
MTTDVRALQILVAGDNVDDVEQIRGVLAREFKAVEVSTHPDREVADFDRAKPKVVVLAFKEIGKAQQYYLRVLRHSALAHGHPHRTVLVCGKDDLRLAFELCKKESFDDYVLYWPQAYDGYRLAMSVWIACRDLAAPATRGPSPAEVDEHLARLAAMEGVIDGQIAEGARHVASARDAMAQASQVAGSRPTVEQLQRALAASHEGVRPISAWAGQLGATVAPHLKGVRELADKARAPRPLIMIVEDDAFAAKLIAKTLESQPWDLVFASEALEALGKLARVRPSLILMDVNLPGMGGLELTERLKSIPALAAIPVVMLTGEARRETLERSRTVGAASFIVKPFTRDGLIAKLAPFVA